MRFRHANTYAADLEHVYAMLVDPAFREEVCATIHAIDHTVEVTETGSGATIEVRQTQVARRIPSFAKKLIGDHVEIVQREQWASPDEGTFEMGIPGKPGQLHGTVRLEERDGACVQVFDGELEVHIPLVGGKLEGLISDLLRKALAAEERVGVGWLSR